MLRFVKQSRTQIEKIQSLFKKKISELLLLGIDQKKVKHLLSKYKKVRKKKNRTFSMSKPDLSHYPIQIQIEKRKQKQTFKNKSAPANQHVEFKTFEELERLIALQQGDNNDRNNEALITNKIFHNPAKALNHIFSHRSVHPILPGKLVVSAYANFFPVCYRNSKGEMEGLDVDIMKQFCQMCGLQLYLVERKKFDGIWFDPVEGKSDVSIGGIGITEQRTRRDTMWTIPYFYVNRTLIYHKSSPIPSLNQIPPEYVIRGTPGSTGWLDGVSRGVNMQPGKTDTEDIADLLSGEIQGLMRGSFVGKSIINKHPELDMLEPWPIDNQLVASDGEVFAYPTNWRSQVGQLLSVMLAQDIFNHELEHLIKKYHLE